MSKIPRVLRSVPFLNSKMAGLDGAAMLCKSLRRLGIEYMFGVVGIPVVDVAIAAQQAGIKFLGMRNEQSASYAASVVGYLTKKPAVCLVVSGPGLVHAIAGMANAKENCWPLLVVGGSSNSTFDGMGAFQEYPQVDASRPYCKYAARPQSLDQIPFCVEKSVRYALHGRPGVSYIDLPEDLIKATCDKPPVDSPQGSWSIPISAARHKDVLSSIDLLKNATSPLAIVGKGCAYSRAEEEIKELIECTGIPFLPTPMGKGVLPDDHPQCVISARTKALSNADVILLIGARLNWILHFGLPPRYRKDVKIIQIDICPEEHGHNVRSAVSLCGDIKVVAKQMFNAAENVKFKKLPEWSSLLEAKMQENKAKVEMSINDTRLPMNFYKMYSELNKYLPKDCIIVNEGANTMDIGRTMLLNRLPRTRLDAGTFGTMGVGAGFAISAAQLVADRHAAVYPKSTRVVCIQGDSAFGFAGMEIETAARYNLPIIFIVANNNGIFSGIDGDLWSEVTKEPSLPLSIPPTALLPSARYEKIMEAVGCRGYYVRTPDQLQTAMSSALQTKTKPSLIHIEIEPFAQKQQQEFSWFEPSKL